MLHKSALLGENHIIFIYTTNYTWFMTEIAKQTIEKVDLKTQTFIDFIILNVFTF